MATTLIDGLLVIQERDRKLARLGQEARDIPLRKKELDGRLDAHRCSMEQAGNDLKKTMASVKETEGAIELVNGRIRKYREQQFQIKNNDEYRALEQEIIKASSEITLLEDKELLLMGQVEDAKKRIEGIRCGMEADEKHVAEDILLLDERAACLQSELDALNLEREGLSRNIPVDILGKYERIMKHLKDVAVVPIETGSCGGCHMNLPPQVVNNAKKSDSLTVCTYCGRIVYRND